MLTVAIAGSARKLEHDNVGPEAANVPDDVPQNLLTGPVRKRVVGGFRESEIDGAGEKLFTSVDTASGEQLLSANDSQFVALLATDQILAALTAGERKICRAHVASSRKVGQKCSIFIVGMGGDHHHAPERGKPVQTVADGGFPSQVLLGAG